MSFLKHGIFLIIIGLFFSGCSRENQSISQGYIEGRYTYIATSVSGTLDKLSVSKGMRVKQGQLLFSLDPKPESDNYQSALQEEKQAHASRNSIVAKLRFAKMTYDRNKILVPKHAIQQAELDKAKSDYDSLAAQLVEANALVSSAEAKLSAAKWSADQKVAFAPVDAMVFDTYYRIGEFTEAKTSILSLLAPSDIKVIFYIPEERLAKIKLNDTVFVQCDQCEKKYSGKISFISPTAEYTPPVIYSNQTNDKLIYRIEAEFAPDDAIKLHPGQPVTVRYG